MTALGRSHALSLLDLLRRGLMLTALDRLRVFSLLRLLRGGEANSTRPSPPSCLASPSARRPPSPRSCLASPCPRRRGRLLLRRPAFLPCFVFSAAARLAALGRCRVLALLRLLYGNEVDFSSVVPRSCLASPSPRRRDRLHSPRRKPSAGCHSIRRPCEAESDGQVLEVRDFGIELAMSIHERVISTGSGELIDTDVDGSSICVTTVRLSKSIEMLGVAVSRSRLSARERTRRQ